MNISDLEEFLDLSSRNGAAVSKFSFFYRFEGFSNLSSSSQFKFERFNGFVIFINNDIIFWCREFSSGQVTDQPSISLGRFLCSQEGKSSMGSSSSNCWTITSFSDAGRAQPSISLGGSLCSQEGKSSIRGIIFSLTFRASSSSSGSNSSQRQNFEDNKSSSNCKYTSSSSGCGNGSSRVPMVKAWVVPTTGARRKTMIIKKIWKSNVDRGVFCSWKIYYYSDPSKPAIFRGGGGEISALREFGKESKNPFNMLIGILKSIELLLIH